MLFTKTAVITAITGGLTALFLVGVLISSSGASVTIPIPDMKVSAPKPSPTASATPTTTDCPVEYRQVVANHVGGKVDSDFEAEYAKATTDLPALNNPQKSVILEWSGKKAADLTAWAHAAGLYPDVSKNAELVSGNCLSPKGQKLHNQLEGALTANGAKVEAGAADPNGYNSGISNGVYGVDASQGVRGDLRAIKITLRDGSSFWIMIRCGNPVYPGKPNLPTVPTDNPPPPPPTAVCIYDSTLSPDSALCLKPKVAKDSVAVIQGKVPVGPDPVQKPAPAPKPAPINPITPIPADPGPSVPIQGATPVPAPAPSSAPTPVATYAPPTTAPGPPTIDPDSK